MTNQKVPDVSIHIEDLGKTLYLLADDYVACTHCLICGDDIPLRMYESGPRVCNCCKEAVLAMRRAYEAVKLK